MEILIKILVSYFIIINIISLSIIWLKSKTETITMDTKKFNMILFIISILGGFIGTLLGVEMLQYEQDNKLFKRWIPICVFIEVCIILAIYYRNVK